MSSIPTLSEPLKPAYSVGTITNESESTQRVIEKLDLIQHPEGGYFAEIDRDTLTIPNPFLNTSKYGPDDYPKTSDKPMSGDNSVRNASTSIYYLLTPVRPQGHFHRNKGRTVHTLIQGRGRYVLIHPEGAGHRVETFIVGHDVANGERAVWIVEGGRYKASFLLPDPKGEGNGVEGQRLLISETVVPGFEFADHDFLTAEKLKTLVSEEQAAELSWLIRKE